MPRRKFLLDDREYVFDDRYGGGVFRSREDMIDPKWVDPTKRNEKYSHPYSYSEFFHFGSRRIIKEKGVHGEYSDRIWGWDHAKAERLQKELVGCRWEHASRAQLSAFMSAFHGRKLTVVALAEGCNPSNGYPYKIIWFKEG
jgi:hypothetical protein